MSNTRPKSGSVQTAEAGPSLAARLVTTKNSNGESLLTWKSAPADLLREAIALVVGEGSLISFGRTSDQGALVVTIIDDGGKGSLYGSNENELRANLSQIVQQVIS